MSLIDKPFPDISLSYRKPAIDYSTYEHYILRDTYYGGIADCGVQRTFVVVAYQTDDRLVECVESVASQEVPGNELIVIDNGISDATRERLRQFTLRHVMLSENWGVGVARNIGAACAVGEWVIFIDDDGIIDLNYACALTAATERYRDVVAFRGRVLPFTQGKRNPVAHYDLGNEPIPALPHTEGNLAVARDAFLSVGGFEHGLYGGEGLVLCYRMVKFYGYEREAFYYWPEMVLRHDYVREERPVEGKFLRNERVRYRIRLTYPDIDDFEAYYQGLSSERRNAGQTSSLDPELQNQIDAARSKFKQELFSFYEALEKERLKRQARVDPTNMHQMPVRITVVIPYRTTEKAIDDTVASVRRQVLNDWEVIVVAASSGGQETQKHLENLGRDIRIISQRQSPNLATILNEGIRKARGRYICCLSPEDWIEPEYLHKAVSHFEMDPDVGIVSSYARKRGDGEEVFKGGHCDVKDVLVENPLHTASCFRRDACDAEHYDSALSGLEDWDHWIRILKNNCRTAIIPEILFQYCQTPVRQAHKSGDGIDTLIKRIIGNHSELFMEHHAYVIATMHKKVLERILVQEQTVNRSRRESMHREGTDKRSNSSEFVRRLLGVENANNNSVNRYLWFVTSALFIVFTLVTVAFISGIGLLGLLLDVWDPGGLLLLTAVGGIGLIIGWVVLWIGMTARNLH